MIVKRKMRRTGKIEMRKIGVLSCIRKVRFGPGPRFLDLVSQLVCVLSVLSDPHLILP